MFSDRRGFSRKLRRKLLESGKTAQQPTRMILRRSFQNELANSAGGVFTVIFSIVLTVGLVGVLHETAGGSYDTTAIFEITIYTGLANLAPLMTASLFIAVLIVLVRAWQDNEMIIWFSAGGRSLLDWTIPVIKFVLPFIAVIAVLSLSVSPWAKGQIQQSARAFQQRDDVSRIAPGRFIEASGGKRVFFIEEVLDGGDRVKNVFMNIQDGDKEVIVEAESGEIKRNALGDRYAVLLNGRRYDMGENSDVAWRVTDFKSYELRLDAKASVIESSSDVDKVPIQVLTQMQDPKAKGQLLWRFCWPFAALILPLLAIPLSCTNTRAGRNLNLLAAALIFILYLNAVSIGVARVKTERMDWLTGLILINGTFFLITMVLFVRRVWMQRWFPQWLCDLPYQIAERVRRRKGTFCREKKK